MSVVLILDYITRANTSHIRTILTLIRVVAPSPVSGVLGLYSAKYSQIYSMYVESQEVTIAHGSPTVRHP